MSSTNPEQWRWSCVCKSEPSSPTQDRKRMHSEVSPANVNYFLSERGLYDDYSKSELFRKLNKNEDVIVCNNCDRVKEIGGQG